MTFTSPPQDYDEGALVDAARALLAADTGIQADVVAIEPDTLSASVKGCGIILTLPSVTEDRHDAVYGETNIRALMHVTVRDDGDDTRRVRRVRRAARRILLTSAWSAAGFTNIVPESLGGGAGNRDWTEPFGDRLFRMRQATIVVLATVVAA
jgi:hypothetical protein